MYNITSAPFFRALKKVFPVLFISRVILTLCGYFSIRYIGLLHPRYDYLNFTGKEWLDMWGFGDSCWYLSVAKDGYSSVPIPSIYGQANIGYFPLYPKLIVLLHYLINNYFLSGLVLTNVMLLVGCAYLYMFLEKFSHVKSPLAVIAWFLLLPGAFMHSAVFSESTLFCMSVISHYYAYKDNWMKAGIFGALAALTKPSGVFLLMPLCLIYLKRYGFTQLRQAAFLLLILLGPISFGVYCYFWHHDFLAYIHIKQTGWNTKTTLPWQALYEGLKSQNTIVFWNSIYTTIILAILFTGIRYISIELWLFSLIQIVFPLTNGAVNLVCMFRYTIVIFPLAIIMYKIKLPQTAKFIVAIICAILQVLFMISYANCLDYIG